jgi:hypothetical protein
MKKITIILALVFLALQSNAQEIYSRYTSSFINESFDLGLFKNSDSKYSLYVFGYTTERIKEKCGVFFDNKEHESFLKTLKDAKQKYIEWKNIAKINDVKDVNKPMEIKSFCNGGFFYYGGKVQLKLSFNVEYYFVVITTEGRPSNYLLILQTGEMKSVSNEFIKSSGANIIFSSEEEIESFINNISLEKINGLLAKPDKKDLFK